MPAPRPDPGFTPRELRALRALGSPVGVQRALDVMPYHLAGTAWSPRRVLRERTAHCLEGAVFAAAALRVLGFPPLLLDLEAVQDSDHVVAVFRVRGHWGAIAKSNFSGLRYREPVHRRPLVDRRAPARDPAHPAPRSHDDSRALARGSARARGRDGGLP